MILSAIRSTVSVLTATLCILSLCGAYKYYIQLDCFYSYCKTPIIRRSSIYSLLDIPNGLLNFLNNHSIFWVD
jgi:hypothetical protein